MSYVAGMSNMVDDLLMRSLMSGASNICALWASRRIRVVSVWGFKASGRRRAPHQHVVGRGNRVRDGSRPDERRNDGDAWLGQEDPHAAQGAALRYRAAY